MTDETNISCSMANKETQFVCHLLKTDIGIQVQNIIVQGFHASLLPGAGEAHRVGFHEYEIIRTAAIVTVRKIASLHFNFHMVTRCCITGIIRWSSTDFENFFGSV